MSLLVRLTAFVLCFVAFSFPLLCQQPTVQQLEAGFRNPPASARPWVFWMWLRVQTNHEAITADLEAMHAKGIEGAILYDSGVGGGMEATRKMVVGHKEFRAEPTHDFAGAHFTPIPEAAMPSWQPKSRELVRFAAKEAARLGVKLVLTVGLASTSGDITLEDSQQRLVWSETAVIGGKQIAQVLAPLTKAVPSSRLPVMSMVPEKAEIGTHPEQQHQIAVLAIPQGESLSAERTIDLTNSVDQAGNLHWRAPAGNWRVLRFAYEPTRMQNAWGLYTDAMSRTALDHTWDVTIGRLMQEMTPEERRGLYGVEDDSWEAGASTWTAKFGSEFKRRRGYDLTPWLPVLAGIATKDILADGVRRDYYRTLADMIAENHYGHLAELARRNGLVSYSEAAGPNSGELDPEQNASHIDVPMGEFWMPSQHRPTPERRFLMHDAASSGHVYGQRVLGCESFTSVGPHWEDTFFGMKNTADQGFTEGCNLNVIHNFSQSPSLTAKPGFVYFAGTHYGRNTTWWDQTPAFNAYLGRSAFLLQQGHFVADALYYRGDAIGQLEQLKKALPAPGYDHDNINLDAVTRRVSVRNGRLLLPDGMSYRILVLPAKARMAPEALQKIAALVREGATVVGPKPIGMDGLMTNPKQQVDFDALVANLWDRDDATMLRSKRIFPGAAVDALRELHLAPDLSFSGISSEGDIDWIHRRTQNVEIYFLASRWDPVEKISATFRVSGMQPELWDPVTGEIRIAAAFTQHDALTTVPLQFGSRGSMFVVFRKDIAPSINGTAISNEPMVTPQQTLPGPWRVSFNPKWGGPAEVTFDKLTDWTARPEDGIRFYSGSAIYRKSFSLQAMPKPNETLLLDLGEVHEEAEVAVNGQSLGVVWTKPSRIDITRAVHIGENTLEVTVVNLWPNRLIGDEAIAPQSRLTLTNAHKFSAATPLLPSGLIGPVTVELRQLPYPTKAR
jgi:hypothetical protein